MTNGFYAYMYMYRYSANEKNYAERGEVDFSTRFLDWEARS